MTPDGVRLRLVGRFAVEGDLHAAVPSGRAQRLVSVLAARHGAFVASDVLIDALWADDHLPDRPERNLAALVSRLRRSLGRERVDGDPRGYRLVREPGTTVDVHEACELVQAAEREIAGEQPARAAASAARAEELLGRGTPLVGEPDAPWVAELRRLVASALARARACRWSAALELGEYRTAIDAASRALAADELDEPACRALMRAHRARGADAAALAAYERLRAALAEQLGTGPSPATREIHLAVLHQQDAAGPAPGIAGRDDEVALLRRHWAAAHRGRGGLVLVTGEAGIGKSALAAAVADEAREHGALVARVRCSEAERSLYLQPLADVVREILLRDPTAHGLLTAAETTALAELVPELGASASAGPTVAPEVARRRTLTAAAELLARVAARRPVLLEVDDLQHAGRTTVEALHFLVTRLEHRRVLVVAAERTSEEPSPTGALRDVATVLTLGPLAREAVSGMLAGSGVAYEPDRFYAWTGGSPLLVSELLRHPEDRFPDIPSSLRDVLAQRLATTAEDVKRLLSQAAVLGVSFGLDDVSALTDVPVEECAHRAARAVRAGFLVPDGASFRFAGDVVRSVAYTAEPRPVQVSRHRRAARLSADRPEVAAGHHAAAGDHAAAARSWAAAAEAAHLVFAHHESERLLSAALASAGEAGDEELRTTVLLRRGSVRCDLARYEDARDDHEEALALARARGDEELEARALEALGWTALWARDAFAVVDLAERASHLAESAASAPGAVRSSLLLLGRVRHWDGDYPGATHAYQQVLAAGTEDATGATAMAYHGALLQHMDRFAEARAVLQRAVALSARTGEFRTLLQSLFFCALARGDVGDFAGALRALDRARRLIDDAGVGYYRAGIETTASWLWQELGELGRAREHAETAVDLAHRGGGALELEQELHALLALADCDLMAGRDDDAGARVEAAAPLLDRSLPFRPRATMRLLEMQARWDPARAEALLEQARTYCSAKYEALALTRLGRGREAAAVGLRTRSDLVLAHVGSPRQRRDAQGRIAAALPAELRERFVSRGRLVLPAASVAR